MKKIVLLVIGLVIPYGRVFAQTIPNNAYGHYLPYTWEVPMSNIGKMVSTAHEDGSITTVMVTLCMVCNGRGVCNVCGGTGGQYWYGMGIMLCGACGGTGKCGGCRGNGYAVMNSTTTPNGVTVGYDQSGRSYIAYPGQGSKSTSTHKCSCCNGTGRVVKDDALELGLGTKYCKECDRTVPKSHYHAPCSCCNGKGYNN